MTRKLLYTFFIVFSFAQANEIYHEHQLLFCLNSSVAPLQIEPDRDGFTVDIPELNQYLSSISAAQIERWIPFATEEDNNGDIYLNRVYRVRLDENSRTTVEAVRADLSQFDFIHSAELEPIHRPFYTPNDYYYNQQWYLQQINANDAWDHWDVNNDDLPGNPQIILASIDTGVDWDHQDLVNSLWQNLGEDADGDGHTIEFQGGEWVLDPGDLNFVDDDDWDDNPSTFVDDLIGWDLSGWSGEDDNNPIPKLGVNNYSTWAHGTHVAGLLNATTDNSTGIASTAFNCRIMSVKVSEEITQGQPTIQDGYAGILYAARAAYSDQGFSVLNNSWGGLGYNQYEQVTINVAHDTYHAVIVAAGGNGDDNGWGELYQTHYPSSYENVISVCPLGSGDSWNHWATYHESIDISSPGENIRSCVINNNYSAWAGSSMASPIVASSIGLLKAFNPTWTNVQLETMILATANPVIYEINSEDYLAGRLGTGRVDVNQAIETGLFPLLSYAGDDILLMDGNDNEINPGEAFEMLTILYNDEDWGIAWEVEGTLTSENEHIVVVSGSTEFWDMEPGGVSLNEMNPFVVQVSEAAAEGDYILTLSITSNEMSWVQYETQIEIPITVLATILMGDMNEDDAVDVLDILMVVNIIMGDIDPTEYQETAGDMNSDGIIDITDIVLLVQAIVG